MPVDELGYNRSIITCKLLHWHPLMFEQVDAILDCESVTVATTNPVGPGSCSIYTIVPILGKIDEWFSGKLSIKISSTAYSSWQTNWHSCFLQLQD